MDISTAAHKKVVLSDRKEIENDYEIVNEYERHNDALREKKDAEPILDNIIEEPEVENAPDVSDIEVGLPKVEIIHAQQAEIEEEHLTEDELHKLGSERAVYFKTREVAARLGCSEQMIRNYSQDFADYLQIEKTPSGHRRYTTDDIERLGNLIKLKADKGLSNEQVIEFLSANDDPDVALTSEKRADFLMQMIRDTVQNTVKESICSNIVLLEEQRTGEVAELQAVVEKSNEIMEQMMNQMEEKNKLLEEKDKVIEELLKKNDDYASKLNNMMEVNEKNHEELLNSLQEIGQKKKKRFFW